MNLFLPPPGQIAGIVIAVVAAVVIIVTIIIVIGVVFYKQRTGVGSTVTLCLAYSR